MNMMKLAAAAAFFCIASTAAGATDYQYLNGKLTRIGDRICWPGWPRISPIPRTSRSAFRSRPIHRHLFDPASSSSRRSRQYGVSEHHGWRHGKNYWLWASETCGRPAGQPASKPARRRATRRRRCAASRGARRAGTCAGLSAFQVRRLHLDLDQTINRRPVKRPPPAVGRGRSELVSI
jgi:hypothetical protein